MCKLCEDHTVEEMSANFKLIGEFLGYPKCCVKSFIKRAINIKLAQNEEELNKACILDPSQEGYNLGFIPCISCANKYPPGQEQNLITNRIISVPYPHGSTYGKYEKELLSFINLKNKN